MTAIPSRLAVVKQIYYQPSGDQPVSVSEARFSRLLATSEQAYERNLTIGEDWQEINPGWLADASCLVLANLEGERLQVIPTAEERADIAARIVEIGAVVPDAEPRSMHSRASVPPIPVVLVHPGTVEDFSPVSLASLRLRCRCGTAKCRLTLAPS